MTNEDDLLVDVLLAVSVNGAVQKFGKCQCGVCFVVLWFEIGSATAWKVDCETRCDVDEGGQESRELRRRATQTMHEHQEREILRQLVRLGVLKVERADPRIHMAGWSFVSFERRAFLEKAWIGRSSYNQVSQSPEHAVNIVVLTISNLQTLWKTIRLFVPPSCSTSAEQTREGESKRPS